MPIIHIKILIKSFESSTLKFTQTTIRKGCLSILKEEQTQPFTDVSGTYTKHHETRQPPILTVNPKGSSPLTFMHGLFQNRQQRLSSGFPLLGTPSKPVKQPTQLNRLVEENTHQLLSCTSPSDAIRKSRISYITLPRSQKSFTVLRSPHIDKKSREQYQIQTHRCRIDISFWCKDKASLLLFLLRNSEFPGTQLRIQVTYSTPFSQ